MEVEKDELWIMPSFATYRMYCKFAYKLIHLQTSQIIIFENRIPFEISKEKPKYDADFSVTKSQLNFL